MFIRVFMSRYMWCKYFEVFVVRIDDLDYFLEIIIIDVFFIGIV